MTHAIYQNNNVPKLHIYHLTIEQCLEYITVFYTLMHIDVFQSCWWKKVPVYANVKDKLL